MKFWIAPFILALLTGCKSTIVFTDHHYEVKQTGKTLPYRIASPRDPSKTAVLLLNDHPDTMNLADSELSRFFVDNGFNIIIPGKAGEGFLQQQSFDSKQNRIDDIVALLYDLDSLKSEELIITGIGEGGYLTPPLGHQLRAEKLIIINAGANSPLQEMETMVRTDTFPALFKEKWSEMGISDTPEFAERIENVQCDRFGTVQLYPSTNNYWLSYYEAPLLQDIYRYPRVPVLWINFENYPLLSPMGSSLTKRTAQSLANVKFREMAGSGNLKNEEQMDTLLEVIDSFLIPR